MATTSFDKEFTVDEKHREEFLKDLNNPRRVTPTERKEISKETLSRLGRVENETTYTN